MAASEIWDYLSATPVTADYVATSLTLSPQRTLTESGNKNQVVHLGVDGSEEIITLSSQTIFYVSLQWDVLTASDAGTVYDFYHDTAKGNGISDSFYWDHPTDGHSYTVRFTGEMRRVIIPGSIHAISQLKLKILGRKP